MFGHTYAGGDPRIMTAVCGGIKMGNIIRPFGGQRPAKSHVTGPARSHVTLSYLTIAE